MGSYMSGYKSLIWSITIVILLITPLLTSHEAPSSTPDPPQRSKTLRPDDLNPEVQNPSI